MSEPPVTRRRCRLLDEDSELADLIPDALRPAVTIELTAPLLSLQRGPWRADLPAAGAGLLVLDGLLIRRVGLGDRYGAELLGQGDLLRPWQGLEFSSLAPATDWRVLAPTRLAVLDDRTTSRLARYPELSVALIDKALGRARRLAATMAILHQARVELRLEMLLWLLADRWGRVRPGDTLVPLALTHAVLAELIAARRPTVSSALAELARQGRVTRTAAGFQLHGSPPSELLSIEL
jgi:CRP/FNR family cyclic AMP-dependent transcriptional regulator